MGRRWAGQGLVVGSCLLAFLGTGCTPTPQPAPPSPSASSPTPTENAQEREQRVAYEAAENSYREFRVEYQRLTASGGTDTPTPKLRETSDGPYQAELMKVLQAFKKAGYRTRGEEVIPAIRRNGYSRGSLLLKACEDDRGVKTVNRAGKQVDNGDVLIVDLEVHETGNSWKVWSGSGSEANSCDGF